MRHRSGIHISESQNVNLKFYFQVNSEKHEQFFPERRTFVSLTPASWCVCLSLGSSSCCAASTRQQHLLVTSCGLQDSFLTDLGDLTGEFKLGEGKKVMGMLRVKMSDLPAKKHCIKKSLQETFFSWPKQIKGMIKESTTISKITSL